MKLNLVERAVVNNPVRSAVQRRYETPLLLRLGGRPPVGRALEVGCGRGVGSEIVLSRFGASEVVAFDLDPTMVAQARKRHARDARRRRFVHLAVGDAAALSWPDASFDAVFDFGIIHHVPKWRAAVAEVARVLRPGGYFFYEEVSRKGLDRLTYRLLFDHPGQDRFYRREFVSELAERGIETGERCVERFFGDFFMGVGVRR